MDASNGNPKRRELAILINEFAAWASTVWPLGNWSPTTTDVCTPNDPYGVVCGTYH